MAQQQPPQLQEITSTVAALQGAKLTRQLKQSFAKTFDFIADGLKKRKSEETGGDVTDEQAFSKDLKQQLHSVLEAFDQVEKLVAHVPAQKGQLAIGNLSHLMQNYVAEQNSAYEEILSTYNWTKKVQDYSTFSFRFISPLVRINQTSLKKHSPPQNVHTDFAFVSGRLLPFLCKGFTGLEAQAVQRGKNCVVLLLTLKVVSDQYKSPLMKVAILLKSMNMEWANVKGADEDFYDDYGKLDIQTQSRHAVFRKVASQAKGALLHLNSQLYFAMGAPVQPIQQQCLRQFFSWVHTYKLLFTEPCVVCKHVLKDFMPPVCRDIRNFAYPLIVHESCK